MYQATLFNVANVISSTYNRGVTRMELSELRQELQQLHFFAKVSAKSLALVLISHSYCCLHQFHLQNSIAKSVWDGAGV